MSRSIHTIDIYSVNHLVGLEQALNIAGVTTERNSSLTTLTLHLNEVDVVQFQVIEEEW